MPSAGPLDVLVVGEHRRDVVRILSREGIRAECSPGIFAAISSLREEGARLVVLGHDDVEGHSTNPVQAIREAKDRTRVLLLHPETMRDDPDRLDRIGADGTLVEPWDHEDLLERVAGLLPDGEPRLVAAGAPANDLTAEELLRQIHRAARDLPVLRTLLVEGLGRLVGAGRASLMLHQPASRALFLAEGYELPGTVQRGLRVKVGSGVAGRVAERARPVAIEDIDRSEFSTLARGAQYESRSFLAVPLVADARVLGVLSFTNRRDGRPYSQADLEAILPVVDTAAAVMRNALLIRRLRAASMLDKLTGLYNRRFFDRARRKELKRARRYGHPLSLLLLDADRFKSINDALGHPAGDQALRALAGVLREVFRETDILCRYGGDEFAVLMPETGRDRARQAADRLRRALASARIPGEDEVPGGKLSVSCGLATFPDDASEAEDLLPRADRELYEQKKGRPESE
jgi:diguanylate cyclase (GGDEF)-like protein